MTATVSRHTTRIPGSTGPAHCIKCGDATFDNFADQFCKGCVIGEVESMLEGAEMLIRDAARLADTAEQVLPDDLTARVRALIEDVAK